MKRLLLLCGISVAFLLVPTAALADHFQPLSFYTTELVHTNVSQQPGAINPTLTTATQCMWDASDYVQRNAVLNSAVDAGASVVDSVCVASDWTVRHAVVEIAADSPGLMLTLSVSTDGSYPVAAVYDKRLGLWVYRSCVNMPTYQLGDPALQPIAGSNGGVAAMTTVSLSASNPTGKRVSKIRYDWGVWPGTC